MTGASVERVASPGGACWMCGLQAVCGEKLPGRRRRRVRPLCQTHAGAVFGSQDPPWRHLDAKTQRDIAEEWLRGLTILAHGGGRAMDELLAEIAAVNETGAHMIRLVSPLMPGEARDLQENIRAQNRLRAAARPCCTASSLRSCSVGAPAPPARPQRGNPPPGAAAPHLARPIRAARIARLKTPPPSACRVPRARARRYLTVLSHDEIDSRPTYPSL